MSSVNPSEADPNSGDYYQRIAASPDHNIDEIGDAADAVYQHFQVQARVGDDTKISTKIQRIKEARETLTDPQTRDQYDTLAQKYGMRAAADIYEAWVDAGKPGKPENWNPPQSQMKSRTAAHSEDNSSQSSTGSESSGTTDRTRGQRASGSQSQSNQSTPTPESASTGANGQSQSRTRTTTSSSTETTSEGAGTSSHSGSSRDQNQRESHSIDYPHPRSEYKYTDTRFHETSGYGSQTRTPLIDSCIIWLLKLFSVDTDIYRDLFVQDPRSPPETAHPPHKVHMMTLLGDGVYVMALLMTGMALQALFVGLYLLGGGESLLEPNSPTMAILSASFDILSSTPPGELARGGGLLIGLALLLLVSVYAPLRLRRSFIGTADMERLFNTPYSLRWSLPLLLVIPCGYLFLQIPNPAPEINLAAIIASGLLVVRGAESLRCHLPSVAVGGYVVASASMMLGLQVLILESAPAGIQGTLNVSPLLENAMGFEGFVTIALFVGLVIYLVDIFHISYIRMA